MAAFLVNRYQVGLLRKNKAPPIATIMAAVVSQSPDVWSVSVPTSAWIVLHCPVTALRNEYWYLICLALLLVKVVQEFCLHSIAVCR